MTFEFVHAEFCIYCDTSDTQDREERFSVSGLWQFHGLKFSDSNIFYHNVHLYKMRHNPSLQ